MQGHCYGCRSQSHEKWNCSQKDTVCHYCARRGHLEAVCQDKFMGLECNRGRLSATSSVPFTLFPNEPAQVAASVPSPANPTTTTPNLTVQIAQLQELLNCANAMAPEAGQITHFACLALTVDDQECWTDFLVTNLGGEDIILGLPWLRKINPEVDWEKGWLSVKTQKVTIEDVPEDTEGLESGRVAAVTTDGSVLEQIRSKAIGEEESLVPEEESPLSMRRSWVKAGILLDAAEEVWCAAGYTYSQQLAEQAHKDKLTKMFEEMVPEPY
ncbi:hypothetical protein GYMLUDRAFT_177563 [Collybiopsis luxurians FD-317 M1]|uniref:Uncharacterized protein n=1 Tax=Collybiopsis luxurians FD-317 M1 TaxID=944289 RepID=A0A0D0C8J8_9AGAR|nr:hypothetical protein GYMLUDRAFT_177563 [Collybiopsis luxurians FD-317 M1]